MTDTTKVTFNLPTDVLVQLKSLASANGTTVTEALRRSIVFNKYIADQEAQNAEIMIREPDGRLARLIRK